jgi:Carboxypeptidase regulatory-like domain/TonB dependent receptor
MIPIRKSPLLVCLALYWILCTGSLWAQSQSIYSSIVGSVADTSGAAIAGVTVKATNINTNVSYPAVADEQGFYRIERLIAGVYTITADHDGFKTFVREGITASAAQAVRVDIRLEVGNTLESVTVTSGSALIETDSPQINSVKSWDLRKYLPTSSNNLYTTLALDAGAVTSNPTFYVSFAGSLQSQYDYQVDGQTFKSPYAGHNGTVANFNEWQQESKTSYVNNSAELSSLAVVNAITKTGGNAFHGSGVWYYTSGGLQGRSPFSPVAPSGVNQRFSTSISGPIIKDRTFFFAQYSGERNSSATNVVATVPTLAMRQGNFASLTTPIIDPSSNAPFQGNVIPAYRISPVAQAFTNRFYPLPNFGSGFTSGNYRTAVAQNPAEDDVVARVDHRFSDRHSIFARYLYDEGGRGNQFTGSLPTVGYRLGYRRDQNAVISDLFTLTPSLINEFSAGWTRDHNLIKGSTYGPDVESLLGIQGIQALPIPSIPTMNIQGLTTVSQQSLQDIAEDIYSARDNISWVTGRHRAKIGVVFANGRAAQIPFTPDDTYGNFSFTNSFGAGNAYANFLLGAPTSISRVSATAFDRIYERRNTVQLFAQDDFQVLRNLTLSYGLRYEYHQPWQEQNGRQYTFDPVTGSLVVPNEKSLSLLSPSVLQSPAIKIETAAQAGYPDRLVDSSTLDFAPRFGFAWRPLSDTVIRGGYGIFYDFNPPAQTSVGPFVASQTYPSNQIVNGTPLYQFPNPFSAQALPAGTLSLSAASKQLSMPYSEQWSFSVEREFFQNTGVRFSYVGTRGVQQVYYRDINQPPASTVPFQQANRPYPQFGPISYQSNGAGHLYNSLQAVVQHRSRNGLFFTGSYTLSKDLGINEQGSSFATVSILNPMNRQADRGDTFYIPRHQVTGLLNWEIPFGTGRKFGSNLPRLLNYLVGDWQTTGIFTAKTGNYLTPTYSGYDAVGNNVLSGRPDRSGNGNLPSDQRSVVRWFDPTAFAIPGSAPGSQLVAPKAPIGRFGNSGVGVIEGPGLWQFDFGLIKQFPIIADRMHLNLFFFGTNIFNHPNLGNPNMDITSPNLVGQITSIVTDSNASGIGMRRITLGARLEF